MEHKRLLLISYYFPPCGGAAVQRWLRFLPFLVRAGWETHVLTTVGGDYPQLDESLLQSLPAELVIHRTPAPRLAGLWNLFLGQGSRLPHGDLSSSNHDPLLKRILIWVRLNLIIPDLRVFWNPSAYRKAKNVIQTRGIRTMITTGPPHSTHLLGLALRKSYHLKWIADWRDPWSSIHYLQLNPPSAISLRMHKYLESKVCASADLNLVISRHLLNSLPKGYKLLLMNGFDLKEVIRAKEDAKRANADKITAPGIHHFLVSYVGQITAGQDLDALLDILSCFRDCHVLKVRFIGSDLSPEQRQSIDSQLGPVAETIPYLPHQDAMMEMARSHLLLMMINRYEGFEGMLTTKLFEYLGVGVPILAIGPRGGEAEALINTYQAGLCVDRDGAATAKAWISDLYERFLQCKHVSNAEDLSSLSSESQSKVLIEALNKLSQFEN